MSIGSTLSSDQRFPLLFGPSPVHRLERLTHRGGQPTLDGYSALVS